jgi:pimeloyl-ACP methyl ester carboxylesterase
LGGGYMSEARYLEVMDYLCGNYSIDKNRIYLIGQSHSSFDLWSLLENHPDLTAAAYLISGSPRYDNIMNVSNLPITNVLSNYDYNYLNNLEVIKEILKTGKYHEIRCKNIISASLSDFTLYSIKDFLEGKSKEEYPDEIYFRTDMNRYLRSFWVNAYGISYGKTYLNIHAKILSKDRIEIEVENTAGFRIKLPTFINKKRFDVTVNQEKFQFEDYDKEHVIFLGIENHYSEVSEWTLPIDYRKGIGILDVYSAPLKIYLPQSHSKIVYETAEKFASPLTNGVLGTFDVNYQIDSILNFNVKQNINHNIIFINLDNNVLGMNQYYGTGLEIPIKTNVDYFQYKEIRYFGEYCILQIIPNPCNNERSILLIYTNNEKLLTRNFLTRNVIIPFMFNGFHPYYHNEAVIMYDKRYYAIYEWGNDLTEI